MVDHKTYDFIAGDILLYDGETYQVHESLGMTGLVSLFPSVDVDLQMVDWDDNYRKIGHEPLPAPTPCATDGSCTPPTIDSSQTVEAIPLRFVE
jgi:hypothetical protein